MTPEKRASKFAHWETLRLEIVKADLARGGHGVVGGNPETRKVAREFALIGTWEGGSYIEETLTGHPHLNLIRWAVHFLKSATTSPSPSLRNL
jgi:hypothetical protein